MKEFYFDYVIIGAGIIGLNIAIEIKRKEPKASVAIIEKEKEVGLHGSGRNSGVLHAGFYYTANSLKARFTKEGNKAMRAFCKERNLSINECAKVVVATNEAEIEGLEELKRRGDKNGVELLWMNQEELKAKYPNIKTYKKALFSPTTATVNPKELTREFAQVAKELGVEIFLNCGYKKRENGYITASKGLFSYAKLINAAGLYADKIAKDFGFSQDYIIIPFKGIYLKDSQNISNLQSNIYPVPNLANPFLGVHYTLTVQNEAKIGPTAIPAFWRENYQGFENFNFQELIETLYYEAKLFATDAFGFRKLALEEIKKYSKKHLIALAKKLTSNMNHSGYKKWSTPGIRAQLLNIHTLELVQDFIVEGDEKTVHILNAVSPAFTSSIPFARWVVREWIEKVV